MWHPYYSKDDKEKKKKSIEKDFKNMLDIVTEIIPNMKKKNKREYGRKCYKNLWENTKENIGEYRKNY